LVVICFGIVQFSSKADLERTEMERWKGEIVKGVIEEIGNAVSSTVVVR
jgi:hypothetical protein